VKLTVRRYLVAISRSLHLWVFLSSGSPERRNCWPAEAWPWFDQGPPQADPTILSEKDKTGCWYGGVRYISGDGKEVWHSWWCKVCHSL